MGKIKKILETDLVGGTQNTDVYPVTSTKAVYDESNKRLDNIIDEIKLGIVYDVSAHNDNVVFESLQALLSSSNLSTLIPISVRHEGMSIRFIQGSVQKYVQYRYMGTAVTGNPNPFLDIVNWQGVDDEPIAGSDNLVKSGGVADEINILAYNKLTINTGVLIENSWVTNNGTFGYSNGVKRTGFINIENIDVFISNTELRDYGGLYSSNTESSFLGRIGAITANTEIKPKEIYAEAKYMVIADFANRMDTLVLSTINKEPNLENLQSTVDSLSDTVKDISGFSNINIGTFVNNQWVKADGTFGYTTGVSRTGLIDITGIKSIISNISLRDWGGLYSENNTQSFICRIGAITANKEVDIESIAPNAKYIALSDRTEIISTLVLKAVYDTEDTLYDLNKASLGGVQLCLPNKIYAIIGDTLQLFYRGFVRAVNPYNYNIVVNGLGNSYDRYHEINAANANIGENDFSIQVYNNNHKLLANKTIKCVVSNSGSSPSSNMNILCFGDSLTEHGEWCAEAFRRLTGSGGVPKGDGKSNINFCGSLTKDGAGYFGAGGWTWNRYTTAGNAEFKIITQQSYTLNKGDVYSNNGHSFTILENRTFESDEKYVKVRAESWNDTPSESGTMTRTSGTGDASFNFSSYELRNRNPLWDYTKDKMTFVPYAQSYANGQIDVVYVLLTWNFPINPVNRQNFDDIIADVEVFANTLHTEFPSAKLKLLGIPLCSVRGGMSREKYYQNDAYGMNTTAWNLMDAYQKFADENSSFVEFVNVASQFDVEYNMPHTLVKANTRSEIDVWQDTNGVHPSLSGYLQIADVVYRNFVANFC